MSIPRQANPTIDLDFQVLHVIPLFSHSSSLKRAKTMPFNARHVANEKSWSLSENKTAAKRLELPLWWRWLHWLKHHSKGQHTGMQIGSDFNFDSPFLDVGFTKSSLMDDALHELGLRDEYSFIGVVDCGDKIPDDSWFVAVSLAAMLAPSCWWCEFDKCGYQVGLRGGQHESLIDWWRWLLFSKRSLS